MSQPRAPKGSPIGGQWVPAHGGSSSGTVAARGDWQTDPLAGEKPGQHTPAAQKRIMEYLERETGMQFQPHGSVSRGHTSMNDFDIIVKEQNEADAEAAWLEDQKWQSSMLDKAARGEITHDQAMEAIYADPGDKMTEALAKIGFARTREMGWQGMAVSRFHRAKTNHTLELWHSGGDPGDAESGPRSWAVDYDPRTGAIIKEERN